MRYFLLSLLLAGSVFAAKAELQLALNPGLGCLLAYSTGQPENAKVSCWDIARAYADDGGPEAAAPFPVAEPEALVAAGTTDFCVIKNEQVRCFNYVHEDDYYDYSHMLWREGFSFGKMSAGWRKLWGGKGKYPQVCAQNDDGSLRCAGDFS